jgi:hypothetical protein
MPVLPRPPTYPKPDNALASSAARMRVLSTRFSTAATSSDSSLRHAGISTTRIPPLLTGSALNAALQGLPPSTQQLIQQLSDTVRQLQAALSSDEQTTNARFQYDEANSMNLADNLSGFEGATTTELQNHAGAIGLLQYGIVSTYTLACWDFHYAQSAMYAVGLTQDAHDQPPTLDMQGYGLNAGITCPWG